MADDIADHQNLSTNKKKEILLFFDHSIAKNKKTNNQIINNMISKFKDLPSGKKYSRNLLKAFMMDASNKSIENGKIYFIIVGFLQIPLEDL